MSSIHKPPPSGSGDAAPLRGMSEIRAFFRTNQTPI
jgi:hypothetical protein